MVDTLGDFIVTLNAAFAELSYRRSARHRRPGGRQGSARLLRRTLAAISADAAAERQQQDTVRRRVCRLPAHYGRVNGLHSAVYPGVVEGLDRLAAHGLKLACLTNEPGAFAVALLAQKSLAGLPGRLRRRRLRAPRPTRCRSCVPAPRSAARPRARWSSSDSSNDAAAARAAGCPVVLVTYGYNHGRPVREVDADGYVDRLDALRLD